ALKHIKNVRLLKGLVTKILTPSDCLVPSSLSMALGLRMEREFPKDDFKKLAADLYSRSAQCGKDPAAIQASYRLGLIRIWEGKCEDAETILSKIVDTPETTDYRMRVAYWRYHCAGEMKNDRLRAQMREWLLREYPLSLHGLLASTEAPTTQQTEIPFLNDHEVEVSFRSKNRAKLNSSVRAIEALQLLEAHPAALEILTPLVDQLAGTEVSFQLYTAVLLLRSGDSIHRFQLMGSLFRENPFLLSRSTITLLYPLQKMSLLQGQTQKLDPYLIISLIRQESAFNDRAKSPAGALGLMQLQPSTARRFERVSKKQLLDPKTNIRVGVKYFTRLLRQYDNDVELALAAYNAGPQNVAEWQKRYPISNRLLFIDLMPLRETRDYVSSIARNYYWYQRLYRSGGPAEVEETPKSSGGFSVFRGLAGK
ncbi:MAG: lytic transglycosylase domain-containing protein, partial [Bdellovibrionota bacterium]